MRLTWLPLLLCLLALAPEAAPAQSLVTEPATTPDDARGRAATSVSLDQMSESLEPFGASLFKGEPFPLGTGANPAYRLKTGDQVAIRIYGSMQADLLEAVDSEGNVFLPEVGPIRLEGVAAGSLTEYLQQALADTFSEDVQVYASLVDARTIGVFVTGFVELPGRHVGMSSDSILDFLARAGGVEPGSGSYRDVRVLRGGEVIARADLYEFLLAGKLPRLEFVEGDTIVVAEQRAAVRAAGAVRNAAIFEFSGRGLSGQNLLDLARPLPGVTYALVSGARGQTPFTDYVPLTQFAAYSLSDQDVVLFTQDAFAESITVSLEGSYLGPSTYVVDRRTMLLQLLDHVPVETELADTAAIHLRRKSVAEQQYRSLQQALDRLERSTLTAVVQTDGEATIRAAEADMVMKFIDRARTVQPEGIVVLASGGGLRDIRLEDGDIIVIPERSSVVSIAGEVEVPQTVLWRPGLSVSDYLEQAGGYADRADESRFVVKRLSGEIVVSGRPEIEAGDEIIVPPEVDWKGFQFLKDVVDIVFKVAVAAILFL